MILIRSTGDLTLLKSRAYELEAVDEKIVLDVAGMAEQTASAWQAKLERHAFSCGCGAGLTFLIVAAAAYVTALGLRADGPASLGWADAVLGLAVTSVGAIVGKFIGLAYSHLQLRRAINVLENALRGLESQTRDSSVGARGNRG